MMTEQQAQTALEKQRASDREMSPEWADFCDKQANFMRVAEERGLTPLNRELMFRVALTQAHMKGATWMMGKLPKEPTNEK